MSKNVNMIWSKSGLGRSLDIDMRALAMEAEFIDSGIKRIQTIFGSLSAIFKEFEFPPLSFTGSIQGFFSSDSKTKDIFSSLNNIKYGTFENVLFIVPEGLVEDHEKLCRYLTSISPTIFKEVDSFQNDFTILLSSFLTNKKDKTISRYDISKYESIAKEREKKIKDLGAFFDSDKTHTRLPLKKIVKRFADLPSRNDTINKLEQDLNAYKLPELKKKLDGIADLMQKLLNSINDGTTDTVTSQAALTISKGAFELAKDVEFLALFVYKSLITIHCFRDNMIQLERITER